MSDPKKQEFILSPDRLIWIGGACYWQDNNKPSYGSNNCYGNGSKQTVYKYKGKYLCPLHMTIEKQADECTKSERK